LALITYFHFFNPDFNKGVDRLEKNMSCLFIYNAQIDLNKNTPTLKARRNTILDVANIIFGRDTFKGRSVLNGK